MLLTLVQKKISLGKLTSYSQNSGYFTEEEEDSNFLEGGIHSIRKSRSNGFRCSLGIEIEGLKDYESIQDDETDTSVFHTLFFPMSCETVRLVCKKDIVSFKMEIIIFFRI